MHGFTKLKSCLINVINYHEKTGLVDEGRAVDIVSLHFSKAFASLSHKTRCGGMGCMSRKGGGLQMG